MLLVLSPSLFPEKREDGTSRQLFISGYSCFSHVASQGGSKSPRQLVLRPINGRKQLLLMQHNDPTILHSQNIFVISESAKILHYSIELQPVSLLNRPCLFKSMV